MHRYLPGLKDADGLDAESRLQGDTATGQDALAGRELDRTTPKEGHYHYRSSRALGKQQDHRRHNFDSVSSPRSSGLVLSPHSNIPAA